MSFKIAILGASSQIARDLISNLVSKDSHELFLFGRNNSVLLPYEQFGEHRYDVVINFVGSGDPRRTAELGASIFDITHFYDQLVIDYLKLNPKIKYIFLSSGAAYGGDFDAPVTAETKAQINFNALKPQDWYAVAKLYSECRHRALSEYAIYDVRVFNYFSHTQDLSARFLITDIVRAIQANTRLQTSSDNIVRDFITPPDFYQMIASIINSAPSNLALDCYSLCPVDKVTLLKNMQEAFGLQYETNVNANTVNATGTKPHYYSLNKAAEKLGYIPSKSSMSGILDELKLTLA